jgi:hypothetical protein
MLSHYTECRYAICRYAECRGAAFSVTVRSGARATNGREATSCRGQVFNLS